MKVLDCLQSADVEISEDYFRNMVAGELRVTIAGSCSLYDACRKILKQSYAYPDNLRN